jgi:hypothetical protein
MDTHAMISHKYSTKSPRSISFDTKEPSKLFPSQPDQTFHPKERQFFCGAREDIIFKFMWTLKAHFTRAHKSVALPNSSHDFNGLPLISKD